LREVPKVRKKEYKKRKGHGTLEAFVFRRKKRHGGDDADDRDC